MTGRLNTWLIVLVAVCALSFWFGKDLVRQATPDSQKKPVSAASYSLPAAESPSHLIVLNGTGEAGLAREVSLLLGRVGCVAESVGNAPGRDYAATYLVNRRLPERKASDLARRLGGIRVIQEWDARGSEDAVLVLGLDWSEKAADLAGSPGAGRD